MSTPRKSIRFVAALLIVGMGVGLVLAAGRPSQLPPVKPPPRFVPTWESLETQQVPEWYLNAKFGIFIHWGVYSVPAFGNEWYPRNMYIRKPHREGDYFGHHVKTYGPHKTFGYKDFIPKFRAEKFDAAQWAKLFKQSGARYIVPVADHHDGFPMYDCSLTDWCAAKMGPKRDIIAELAKAVRKEKMYYGVSSHRAFNWVYYARSEAFDTVDPANFGLYGRPHEFLRGPLKNPWPPQDKAFMDDWLARTKELVDKYRPDLMWFDFGIGPKWVESHDANPFAEHLKQYAAYYYNRAAEWGKGVAINYKHHAFPEKAAVLDIERGKLDAKRDLFWQTDTSVSFNSWGYITQHQYKPVDAIVDDLVDIVAKNGCMLLNIGPKADGTIPDREQEMLRDIGRWLRVNGEAIYDTRAWEIYGEGPTGTPKAFREKEQARYTPRDIRFTAKGDVLYATLLAWPGEKAVITSLADRPGVTVAKDATIRMLGDGRPMKWTRNKAGLTVTMPDAKPCEHAFVLKITGVKVAAGALSSAAPVPPTPAPKPKPKTTAKLKPTWESLAKHNEAPDWFRDAKYGIYFHWGVYSVPAFGSEWYPRNMHGKSRREYKHHVEKYGNPVKYGYDKFVPQFKAEKFDADEWAELFRKAGAKFAGPVAEHHDGFAMWDSKLTPWNAKDMGPKRDITGELAAAVRKRGMKFFTSFHHARNSLWQIERNGKKSWTGHYQFVKTDFPAALEDPKRAILYGYMPRKKFLDMWLGKLKEVIDQYQPDIMWFDSWLHEIPDAVKMEYLAYYINESRKRGQDVVITFKQQDLPQNVGVLDLEKGRMNKLTDFTWLTDDTISKGSWCYTKDLQIKSTPQVLHVLIDIVSKNGQLVLNISPKADGTIPDVQKKVLLGIGKWLDTCGEAIYGTRPFAIFGEGPTRLKKGGGFTHRHGGFLAYTGEDIRFTTKGDVLYAILLGWPGEKAVIKSLAAQPGVTVAKDATVRLFGVDGNLKWSRDKDGLSVQMPKAKPTQHAFALKITGVTVAPGALKPPPTPEQTKGTGKPVTVAGAMTTLPATAAYLHGTKLDVEKREGAGFANIGFWDKADEWVSWKLLIKQAGAYEISGRFASAKGGGQVTVDVAGQKLTCKVPKTGGWDDYQVVTIGTVKIAKGGEVVLSVRPKAQGWAAANLASVTLKKK